MKEGQGKNWELQFLKENGLLQSLLSVAIPRKLDVETRILMVN